MIDISDPTVAHLLAACVANPDELDCALRLADAIEAAEGGVPCPECPEPDDSGAPHPADIACRRCGGGGWLPHPRAEFIRVQCELEGLRHDNDEETHRINRLTRRAGDLLRDHERAWRSARCERCGGTGREELHTAKTDGTNGPERFRCPHCWGTGDCGGLLVLPPAVLRDEGDDTPAIRYSHPVRWRRGLIDRVEVPRLEECFERGLVGCPECERLNRQRGPGGAAFRRCARCDGGAVQVWRPTPWMRAVVAHHPTVTSVVPLDREPQNHSREVDWFWVAQICDDPPSHALPKALFDAIHGGDRHSMTPGSYCAFDTREAAVSALGRAVVRVARG